MQSNRAAVGRTPLVEALGRRTLERAIASGELVRLLEGVYAWSDLAGDHRVRCHAAVLAGRGHVTIGGLSALHLTHPEFPAPPAVEVLVSPPMHGPAAEWIRARRTTFAGSVRTLHGMRVMWPADAVVDAWTRATPRVRRTIVYDALWLRIARPSHLFRAVGMRARVPQRALLLDLLEEFRSGAQSPGEVMARREVFAHPKYLEFERQVSMVAGGDRRIDMLHRAARLVVEIDSDAHHSTPAQVARDHERDIELAALGYQTLRYRYRQLRDRPAWCRASLDRVLAARLRGLSPNGA